MVGSQVETEGVNFGCEPAFRGKFVTTGTHVSWHASNGGTLVLELRDDGQSTNFGQVGQEFNGAFVPG